MGSDPLLISPATGPANILRLLRTLGILKGRMACRAFPVQLHPDFRSSALLNNRHSSPSLPNFPTSKNSVSFQSLVRLSSSAAVGFRATASPAMDELKSADASSVDAPMKLLFVEMGVGYDQHGQDITVAAMRACKDAISSNSIPAFRSGAIPGVNTDQMKLRIKLGVPRSTQPFLDVERVKSIFPYGKIMNFEVVDGGLICSSGVCLEAMGDKNDDCYVVNAAVYVGY